MAASDLEPGATRWRGASPGQGCEAWIDPDRLARGWEPLGFRTPFHGFDPRPGGLGRFTLHGPGGQDHPNEGRFLEAEAGRLVTVQGRSHLRA